jgi:hypothetical protein
MFPLHDPPFAQRPATMSKEQRGVSGLFAAVRQKIWAFVGESGKIVLGSGIALWLNTVLDKRLDASLKASEHKQRLEEKIVEKHNTYSKCMREIYRWKHKHGDKYGEVFVKQMEDNQDNAAVERINDCRSLTKDFWRLTFILLETHPVERMDRDDYKARHDRFVSLVQPLDALEGYSQESTRVYVFPERKEQ